MSRRAKGRFIVDLDDDVQFIMKQAKQTSRGVRYIDHPLDMSPTPRPAKATLSRQNDEKKPKKPKHFLENKDEALELARSVVAVQEDKSHEKVEKQHRHLEAKASTKSERKSANEGSSKARLKQVKAALTTEAIHAKREKAKLRRNTRVDGLHSAKDGVSKPHVRPADDAASRPTARKRVSFA